MRVIETFVKHVPREKLPADAKWFMQDGDGELKSSPENGKPYYVSRVWMREKSRGAIFNTVRVSSDAAETVVTREELMRAYDLVEQGYTL